MGLHINYNVSQQTNIIAEGGDNTLLYDDGAKCSEIFGYGVEPITQLLFFWGGFMKKNVVIILLALGVAASICACGNNKNKPLTEKDLETISDEQIEKRINALDEQSEKKEGKVEEPESEAEEDAGFNVDEDGKYSDVDPYTEVYEQYFGLTDFPKMKEDYVSNGTFRTHKPNGLMNSVTGDKLEPTTSRYSFESPECYDMYRIDVEKYVSEHGYRPIDLDCMMAENEDGSISVLEFGLKGAFTLTRYFGVKKLQHNWNICQDFVSLNAKDGFSTFEEAIAARTNSTYSVWRISGNGSPRTDPSLSSRGSYNQLILPVGQFPEIDERIKSLDMHWDISPDEAKAQGVSQGLGWSTYTSKYAAEITEYIYDDYTTDSQVHCAVRTRFAYVSNITAADSDYNEYSKSYCTTEAQEEYDKLSGENPYDNV